MTDPAPITPIFLILTNDNIIIIANIKAVVEKLDGKININVIKQVAISSFRDSQNQ
jgi:hypothetical protein